MRTTLPLLLLALFLVANVSRADYAPPPDEPLQIEPSNSRNLRAVALDSAESSIRLFTGPALHIDGNGTVSGLMGAFDFGSRAAGGRIGASWAGAGNAGGVSQYTAELWLDFARDQPLRPIVAAGAGVSRLDIRALDSNDDIESHTVGVGVLRGTLQYQLPVVGVDARVGLDLVGTIPALGRSSELPKPWLTASLGVGIGF